MISQSNPPVPRVAHNTMAAMMSRNRWIFSLGFRFLNLREKMRSGEFISQHSAIITGMKTYHPNRKEAPCVYIEAYPIQNIAFAGMGIPMKEVVCRVSILNLASLTAPATGMRSTVQRSHSWVADSARSPKSIMAGATPNVTRSHRESSSLPRFEYAWRALAANPSRKSAAAPTAMNMKAHWKALSPHMGSDPPEAAIIDMQPARRLRQVIELGMLAFMGFIVFPGV